MPGSGAHIDNSRRHSQASEFRRTAVVRAVVIECRTWAGIGWLV